MPVFAFTKELQPSDKEPVLVSAQGLAAFVIFLLQGVGCLLPWNAFISAPDYFNAMYGKKSLIYMEVTSSVASIACLTLMTLFGHRFGFFVRMMPSYTISTLVLTIIPILGIIGLAGTSWGLPLTLLCVAFNSVATSVWQTSILGLAALLPSIHLQSSMIGRALAGVLTSMIRIVTKLVFETSHDEAENWKLVSVSTYFFVAAAGIIICAVSFIVLMKLPYTRYYLAKVSADAEEMLPQATPLPASSRELSDINIGIEESPAVASNDDDQPVVAVEESAAAVPAPPAPEPAAASPETAADTTYEPLPAADAVIKKSKASVWSVVKTYWLVSLQHLILYATTLSVFPGLAVNVKSSLGDLMCREWTPILMTLNFNIFDLMGRLPAKRWGARQIGLGKMMSFLVLSRILIVPLFAVLVNPRPEVLLTYDIVPHVLMAILAFSNGYLSTIITVLAPAQCATGDERQIVSTLTTLTLLIGINVGSLCSLGLGQLLLGEQQPNPCP